MKKRLIYGSASILLLISALVVVWLGSFSLGGFKPTNPNQTLIFWGLSSLIFLVMLALLWYLFREGVKLYIERQSRTQGSMLKTKLVLGALALSCVPVFFLVLFNYELMNHQLGSWFRNPGSIEISVFEDAAAINGKEMQDEANAQAALLAALPETRALLTGGAAADFLKRFCSEYELESAAVYAASGNSPVAIWNPDSPATQDVAATAPVEDAGKTLGWVKVAAHIPLDTAANLRTIEQYSRNWQQMWESRKSVRSFYIQMMLLITVIVLCMAMWIAFALSKLISVPISAILEAASEVSKGNLNHRIELRAADELGTLVRGFNQMTEQLQANRSELDRRQRFTEAILESIPTGVLSITADGSIKRVNHALAKIFSAEEIRSATRLEDLFSREDTAEIKYLMKRARRTGAASRQMELFTGNRKLHLAVTVSALEEKLTSAFVVVLEDTSELLRAQKSAAWHEVARRVAHEIKNPLTPIALSAERIGRQIEKLDLPPANARILDECAATIAKSVESVKTLVDEFSQFARFPSAQPVRCDLNEVVQQALGIFHGRLDGITIRTSYAAGLPAVNLDREQFQRVVVNLVDNAAEAMQESLVKNLYVATQAGAETVELVIADSGCGIGPDDKERLFLPYFSTKNRGTGLGLAIVSHIVAEHNAQIRVEDNLPVGARFTIEIPALIETDEPVPAPQAKAVRA